MSSSIKPPTGSSAGLSSVGAAPEAAATQASEAGRAGGVSAQAETASAARAEGPGEVWLRQLQAGEVTREQAIEGLVQRVLDSHGGATLAPAHRRELEQVLRAAVADDPVLSRLLGGREP